MPCFLETYGIGLEIRMMSRSVRSAATCLFLTAGLSAAAQGDISPDSIAPFSAATPGPAIPAPWRHQPLPNVERENRFDLVADEDGPVLRVRSQAAASTLLHPLDVDPARTPVLAWRWKVSAPVAGSDFTRKAGDDYAGRVYVLFDLPLERLSFAERVKIGLARTLHGAQLPAAAIAYVWGNAQPTGASGSNPYTERVHMIVVESGPARAGKWVEERRDVAADFRAAFGGAVPRIKGVAVSADTDNTGEAVTAWFGDLRFLTRE